jgi:hypothetical protein
MSRFKEFLDSYNLPAVVALLFGLTAAVIAIGTGNATTIAVVFGLLAITSAQLS